VESHSNHHPTAQQPKQKMQVGAPVVEVAEQIKWWDVLDALATTAYQRNADFADELQRARECRHPDAQWLASLFPAGVSIDAGRMRQVMLERGNDPRRLRSARDGDAGDAGRNDALLRVAEMGYAPAQALVNFPTAADALLWAQRAAAQGHRDGLFELGRHLFHGLTCEKDRAKGIALVKAAAELELNEAQYFYGEEAFGKYDWERYLWLGRAVLRRFNEPFLLYKVRAHPESCRSGVSGVTAPKKSTDSDSTQAKNPGF
jgi:TPR repeat protein